ncbi:MAG: UbiH/UbiF family hydroxylase [Burkholderiales bacterium]
MNFDLIVVGAGLAGASFARAARGFSTALIAPERRTAAPAPVSGGFDARVYALSPANAEFLRDLKVWQGIAPERLTPVHAMRVYGDDGRSLIEFDAYQAGVDALAWIVEDGVLQDALRRSLETRDGLEILAPAQCERLESSAEGATVHLRGGRSLHGKLVVGADGAHSFVREATGLGATERAYGQTAVVANFACERPHGNVAQQWFQGGPVLALLPLPGSHVSMVWSLADAEAARVLALDVDALCREVEQASHGTHGVLTLVTPARGFALRRLAARRLVVPRVALIGDAAHVVHPLAGQGANLGLQDARALAQILAACEPVRDPGDLRLLRRYARSRAEGILAMDATVHGLYRLFAARGRAVSLLRNAGLNLTDRVPVLKNILMRQAMG